MAVRHGKDGVVKVGANTVASVTAWSLSEKIATVDKSAIGDTDETHLVGLKSGSGKVDCLLDPADANGQEALTLGASVTLNLYPQGTTTGLKYWTFTATIESLDGQGGVTEVGKRSFGFKANGAISWATA